LPADRPLRRVRSLRISFADIYVFQARTGT
jgi:hypothetical protein